MAVGMPRTATVPPRAEGVRAVVCFWQQVLTTLTSWGWCSCVPRRGAEGWMVGRTLMDTHGPCWHFDCSPCPDDPCTVEVQSCRGHW